MLPVSWRVGQCGRGVRGPQGRWGIRLPRATSSNARLIALEDVENGLVGADAEEIFRPLAHHSRVEPRL